MSNHPIIPISVFTGFLGSGKTTLINKLIKSNPQINFGLIINEFGEVGIDGKIIDKSQDEIIEISDGCMCCVVRSDLVQAVEKMLATGKVDYLIIETSGLAEPLPILQTFAAVNAGLCKLDALVTVVDVINYNSTINEYKTAKDQVQYADVVVINKVEGLENKSIEVIQKSIIKLNDQCSVVINDSDFPTNLLLDVDKYDIERLAILAQAEEEDNHHHDHHTDRNHHHHDHSDHDYSHSHNHEHNHIDEVVWKTTKAIDPHKMDFWLKNNFPVNAIRSKGILQIETPNGTKSYVFQMVGANKSLVPLDEYTNKTVENSSLVLIGKKLDKTAIIESLELVVG